MNVFVDECVNKKLMPHLIGHRFVHATDTSLRSTKMFSLTFVILRSVSSKFEDVLLLVPETLTLLDTIAQRPLVAGDLYEIMV